MQSQSVTHKGVYQLRKKVESPAELTYAIFQLLQEISKLPKIDPDL